MTSGSGPTARSTTLSPSIARARTYVAERRPAAPADLIAEVIDNHHRLGRARAGIDAEATEAFRRADAVDVSRGCLSAGLSRGFVRDVVAAFPYAGFHGLLVRTAWSWWIRHPLRPLPMVRVSAPSARAQMTR